MNKGEYQLGRNKPIFDDNLQYGKQLPDGELEWHGETVAYKLGWTTEAGRLRVQAFYDQELRQLGVKLSDDTYLRWYTRRREFTEPEEILPPVAEVPDILSAPGFPQESIPTDALTADETVLDVSGTESREPTDPTHLVIDEAGLLVGALSPTEPAVVTGGQAIIAASEEPATEQLPPAEVTQVTAIVPTADPTQADVTTHPTAAIPF